MQRRAGGLFFVSVHDVTLGWSRVTCICTRCDSWMESCHVCLYMMYILPPPGFEEKSGVWSNRGSCIAEANQASFSGCFFCKIGRLWHKHNWHTSGFGTNVHTCGSMYLCRSRSILDRFLIMFVHDPSGHWDVYVCAKAGEGSIVFVPKPTDFAKKTSGEACLVGLGDATSSVTPHSTFSPESEV